MGKQIKDPVILERQAGRPWRSILPRMDLQSSFSSIWRQQVRNHRVGCGSVMEVSTFFALTVLYGCAGLGIAKERIVEVGAMAHETGEQFSTLVNPSGVDIQAAAYRAHGISMQEVGHASVPTFRCNIVWPTYLISNKQRYVSAARCDPAADDEPDLAQTLDPAPLVEPHVV
jgi:hypothetical protein